MPVMGYRWCKGADGWVRGQFTIRWEPPRLVSDSHRRPHRRPRIAQMQERGSGRGACMQCGAPRAAGQGELGLDDAQGGRFNHSMISAFIRVSSPIGLPKNRTRYWCQHGNPLTLWDVIKRHT